MADQTRRNIYINIAISIKKMNYSEDSEDGFPKDLRKPLLHTGSWYRMSSRQSSMLGSSQAIRDSSISVLACVLIVALGPIHFGFTCGYSSPTQDTLSRDLRLAVSEDSSFLYMGRIMEGFGVGIISYTVPVYIAEIAPQNMRGGLGTLPCLVLIPGLFFIPESPRWLAKMGMTEDFEISLQVLRGFDTDISLEVNEIKRSVASTSRRTAIHFGDLKQRRYWFPLMGMIIAFSLGMGPIPWIIMSEILPIKIIGLAGSVATLAN
ncbi:hypothetical protein AgCh_003306 [Apium graveolens]